MEIQPINSFNERFVRALSLKEQTAKEIAAIKNDPRLQEKIVNSPYEIEKNDQGYLVVTDWCTVQVDVIYLPPEEQICGPVRFELKFHDALEKFPHIEEKVSKRLGGRSRLSALVWSLLSRSERSTR